MRIAFYAPLKPPDSPIQSGDRLMGQQLFALLEMLGHDVRLVSRLRTRLREPGELQALRFAADAEIVRLHQEFVIWRPQLWFTYHLYYRAPDLLGPNLSASLAIPYVAAEASHAARRAEGEWAQAHELASQAIAHADLLFAMTARDARGLEAFGPLKGRLHRLPPFLADAGPAPAPRATAPGQVNLFTVAMMREGGKLGSYRLLAQALWKLRHLPWRLGIAGDGPARLAVQEAFAGFEADRIVWHGLLDREALSAAFAAADIFVWPGFNEAYGMVYLEAAASGLPCVAMASGGVPDMVRDGETGVLVEHGDVDAMGTAIANMIGDFRLRERLGQGARRMLAQERTLAHAMGAVAAAFADLEISDGC